MDLRNLNCLFAVLISFSGLSLSTLYSCAQSESEQAEHYLNRVAAPVRVSPDVSVIVVNEVKKAEVTVQELVLEDVSRWKDMEKENDKKVCVIEKIDYPIILGATRNCFPPFSLGESVLANCCLEVVVSFAPLQGEKGEKREARFRYSLKEVMASQFVFGQDSHIGVTIVLVDTEEGGFDAEWLVTGL